MCFPYAFNRVSSVSGVGACKIEIVADEGHGVGVVAVDGGVRPVFATRATVIGRCAVKAARVNKIVWESAPEFYGCARGGGGAQFDT